MAPVSGAGPVAEPGAGRLAVRCVQVSDTTEPVSARHLLRACCPCWGQSCSSHRPLFLPLLREASRSLSRGSPSLRSPFQPLPRCALFSPLPTPQQPRFVCASPSPRTLPSRREQAAHFKNTESPRTWLRACPSSILNRESKHRELQATWLLLPWAAPRHCRVPAPNLDKVTGCDRVWP